MNIAIIHDWLSEFAGADKVLWQLKQIYPDADIYTSIYDEKRVKKFSSCKVHTTYLQKLPFSKKLRPIMIPLMPLAFEQLDLSKYDLVISNSTAAAKGVITKPSTCHISYCHTPTRYLWEPSMDTRASSSWLRRKVNHTLRLWDFAASRRVDYFIANSQFIGQRIKKFYRRDSEVVYPPVDTSFYKTNDKKLKKGDHYLFVGRFVPYKKADLAVKAFNQLGIELRLIGSGPEEKRLKKIAKKNIKFLGRASDDVLLENLRSAKALIFPSEEDFGIVPVEAMACGTPVIAYSVGGATETVIAGKTGEFFSEQTAESLIEVIKVFDPEKYKLSELQSQAEKFSNENFQENFQQQIEDYLRQYKKDNLL